MSQSPSPSKQPRSRSRSLPQRIALGIVQTVLLWALLGAGAWVAVGCNHNIHPGAVSTVDSNAYDTLLISQAALDEGRRIIAEHPDPEYITVFNKATTIYNQALADWQLYHSTQDPHLEAKLSSEINQVVVTIADMRKAFGKKVGK